MNNIFQFIFICLLIIMVLQFFQKKKFMTSQQRGIVAFLYVLTIIGYVALYFPDLRVMPSYYFIDFFTPYVKMWVT